MASPDTAADTAPQQRLGVRLRAGATRLAPLREYGIVVAFVLLFVVLSFSSSAFLTGDNLLNILDQNAPVGIIACAGTLVIIARGFDISTGAIFAASGVVAALVARDAGTGAGIAAGVAVSVACGCFNGLVITLGRINTFIATLATSIIIRGLATALADGEFITVSQSSFEVLGNGTLGPIDYSTLCWLAFALLCGGLLWKTTYGQDVYAVGGNPEAARLSGIRVNRVIASTFVLSGFAAGVAGAIGASRVSTGQADVGVGLELTAIAAIVIGGTSIQGGEGAIWRTVLGVLLLALIGNGFNLLNVDPVYQMTFQGAVILIAVGIDAWSRKRQN
jgi:ribose transport system permease protein